jgi:hypothetical protein
MKMKLVLFIATFLLTNVFANPMAQGEMWLRVSDYNDVLRAGVTITVYDSDWQYVDSGISADHTVEQEGNAYFWMAGEPVSTSNEPYVIGPLNYESSYYIVIDSKYAKLIVGAHIGTPDEHLRFKSNYFSLDPTHNIFSLAYQAVWYTKTIVVKNSFNDGNVKIDDELYQNIGSSGITKIFGSPTFPHNLEAIDNQSSGGYVQKYQNWSGTNTYYTENIAASITAENATYTANFKNQFDLTFQNNFVGVGNGGTIKVNGVPVNSPTGVYHTVEDDLQGISFEATDQTINGIQYTFDEWNDSSPIKSRTIYPDNHEDYVASFVGKPVGVGGSLTFNSGARDGRPVILYWDDNVNSAVQYKIYRKHGKFGATSLISTKNSGVETYTDYDMSHTSNTSTDNLTWYDVRAYYPTEGTSADEDFSTLYAELLPKQSNDKTDSTNAITEIKENNIKNFPNPFNPTTTVYYKLKERGNVTIKVYDALGKEVAVLVNESKTMGDYVAKFDGSRLSSGVYIIRMQINNSSISKKILLTK